MSAVTIAYPAGVNAGVSTIAESTRRTLIRYDAATNVFVLCIILMYGNRGIRKQLKDLRSLVSNLIIEDGNDRARLLDPAKQLGKSSAQWEEMHQEWISKIMPRLPENIPLMKRLGAEIARQLEELAWMTEDIAETLALASSESFAQLVRQELDTNCSASVRNHGTA